MALREWINHPDHKLTFFLEGNQMVTPEGRLLKPRNDPPFDPRRLTPIEWTDIDLRVESQGPERRTDSIQAHMAEHLRSIDEYDILINDDGSGEAADLVGVRVDGSILRITLVHCKYSAKADPGARVADLYEVCG